MMKTIFRSWTAWVSVAVFAPVASAAISIAPSSLPSGQVGTAYSQTFSASGGRAPYTWASSALPGGLQLGSSTGTLSGLPTVSGNFSFTVQATDSSGALAQSNLTLAISPQALAINTVSPLFVGTVGSAYSQQFSASGGVPPYTWSISGGQVPGLALNTATGALSGTPTAAGNYSFTIGVKDSAGTSLSGPFTLQVNTPALVITTAAALPAGTVGIAYSQTIAATGGTPPYRWGIASGSVAGLSIDSASGIISGVPTSSGTFTPNITVTDASGAQTTKAFSLIINAGALGISTTSPLPDATAGTAYSQTFSAVGGTAPYTWSFSGFPAGLTGDPNAGTLSGVPNAAGSFQVAVRVTDSHLTTFVNVFSLNVDLPAVPTVSVSGPAQTLPASNVSATISLASAYVGDVTGTVSLVFTPTTAGAQDPTIQFSTGGTSAPFTIAAGTTSASVSLQTGTVAGTITLSFSVQAFTEDVTPKPAPSIILSIPNSAPGIISSQMSVNGQTVTVSIIGYSDTSR